MSGFRRILVANRGEIALRVMRTARRLGYHSIAIYSAADADSPHVQYADDACLIGPAPAAESYLNAERVLAAARLSGAEAIHPGYGFLSENAAFARAVAAAGMVFIGPPPESIELMGNKAEAKRRMMAAGVPCVPGYQDEDQSDEALVRAAAEIGYPIMVKAAAGGGGRGMRLVLDAAGLPAAIRSARSEAGNAFGSGELILERGVIRPRHVEIQVFADSYGNVIHLGERDCSVQRRHQKVIEESPCPVVTSALREQMGRTAVEAARNIDYRGAGTVEFLLDHHGEFFFLEMNTRLQVEHPVTELVTGLDLVELQIKVAAGQPLGISQDQVCMRGHAIEARLYAEDPGQDFLPVAGQVLHWQAATGPGLRIDAGIASGQQVSPFYDPMLAKVIAHGETRELAISRLIEALEQTQLFGLTTNRAFLADILERPRFRDGAADTAFIAEEFGDCIDASPLGTGDAALLAVLQFRAERDAACTLSLATNAELLDWSSRGNMQSHYRYLHGVERYDIQVHPIGGAAYRTNINGRDIAIEILSQQQRNTVAMVDGRRCRAAFLRDTSGGVHLARGRHTFTTDNSLALAGQHDERDNGGRLLAPMHGVLLEVFVHTGDRVAKGTPLAVLEAMKMQHELLADVSGVIESIAVSPGTQVAADELLLSISVDAKE